MIWRTRTIVVHVSELSRLRAPAARLSLPDGWGGMARGMLRTHGKFPFPCVGRLPSRSLTPPWYFCRANRHGLFAATT